MGLQKRIPTRYQLQQVERKYVCLVSCLACASSNISLQNLHTCWFQVKRLNRKRKAPATRVNVEPATATTTKSRRSDKDAAEALLDLYTKALEHKKKTTIEGLTSLGNPVLKANTADFMTSVDSSSDVLPFSRPT